MSDLLSEPIDDILNSTSASEESPLPTENEIEEMLAEIRQLEQEEIESSVDNESK